MQDIRCGHCNKKLGVGDYRRLVIKCPRCGVVNHLRAMSPAPARHRASETGEVHDQQAAETPR